MARKRHDNNEPSRSTRALQIMFAVFSILLILSMLLSLFVIR
jgi:hypothetical protein